MALSAVYRTGQRFGVNHLIDVLRGIENDRMFQYDHHHAWGLRYRQGTGQQPVALGLPPDWWNAARPTSRASVDMERFGADLRLEDVGLWEALRECRRALAGPIPPCATSTGAISCGSSNGTWSQSTA
jgi:hypothetical protein